MSFCIRSISNSSRYVPTFVASAQGCAARRFNSQQSSRHVKAATTSSFLNEFLDFNVPSTSSLDTGEDCKMSNVSYEILYDTHPRPSSVEVKDLIAINHISNNENYHLSSQNVTQILYGGAVGNYLISPNKSEIYKSNISAIKQKENLDFVNHRINFISTDTCTKDKTKVKLSNILNSTSSTLAQSNANNTPTTGTKQNKKPTPDQFEHVYLTLSVDLPRFFAKSIDYRIYNPDIEFINNIKGTRTQGIAAYVKQMAFLRIIGHFKYAYVKLEVLKITMHTDDNTIRVRWRISGITGLKVFLQFWRFKIWKIQDAFKDLESWHDGFSTFYVGEDGLIFRHVVDKVVPDEDKEEIKPKGTLPTKLASQLTFSSLN